MGLGLCWSDRDAQNPRYEPGPTGDYGADGIPREGMAETYATAMWRDDPSAFWLHPEGPLSDTTPDEYFVPRPEPTERDMLNRQYAAQGMLGGYQQASAMAQYQNALASAAAYNNSARAVYGLPNYTRTGALDILSLLR